MKPWVIIAALALAGCRTSPAPKPLSPVPETAKVQVAQQTKDEVVLEAAGRIDTNNEAAPESPQKPLIDADVDVIRQAVASAPAGDLIPIIAAVQQLAAERNTLHADLTKAKKELQEAKDSVWQRVQFWTSLALYGGAVLSLVLAVLRIKAAVSTGLDIVAGAKSAAFLLSLCATLFSIARFVAAWWFPWACGGVVALAVCYVGFLVWKEERAKAAIRTIKPLVRTLDAAYEAAGQSVKDDMDETIFSRLSEEMKSAPGAKAFIHQVRAEDQKP